MQILEILNTSASELIPEDLELFRTELMVGEYDEEYKRQCLERIDELERWNKSQDGQTTPRPHKVVYDNPGELQGGRNVPFAQQFRADMNAMRLSDSYKTKFKTYISNRKEFDEQFVDENFNSFQSQEIEVILSEMTLSEAFLEKYFAQLDKDKIARYQLFSEGFFRKHFADFDTETVLKKGRNEWRKKENRSKQLDVFLRLKGITD